MKDTVFVRVVETNVDLFQTKDFKLENHCVEIMRMPKRDDEPCDDLRILVLVEEFKDIFKEKLKGLPPVKELVHKIKLKVSLPKALPLYRLTPKEDLTLQKHLKEAIGNGLIRSSKALYGAGVFFVAKKTGDLRGLLINGH